MKKKDNLNVVYYKNFLILIVIPMLVVFVVAIGTIKMMMVDSAIKNIHRTQNNIIETLTDEIKDASLRLAHFLLVNDHKITDVAAKTDTVDIDMKHKHTKELTSLYNFAMTPLEDIVSATFFMKNGNYTCIKEDFIVPQSIIKGADWYQKALENEDNVKVGSYNKRITPSKYGTYPFYIAVGMAPGREVDRSGKIEMAMLVSKSRIEKMIKMNNRDSVLGHTVILNERNEVIYDMNKVNGLISPEVLDHVEADFREKVNGRTYLYVVNREPITGWKVINIVYPSKLIGAFTRIAVLLITVILGLLFFFYVFSMYFLRNIIHPINKMVEGLWIVETGNLDVHIEPSGQSEIRTMIHSFNQMVRQLKVSIYEKSREQQKKQEAEIRALQSQINPHFLVNTLSSIRFMAQVSRFDGIRKMAEALIKILSCSFRSNIGLYTVGEELDMLESFIFLMKIRYSDGFEFYSHIGEDCLEYKIPRLILQPIVENSIVHGFSELIDDIGVIHLSVKQENQILYFVIEDNGKGMTSEKIEALLQEEDTNWENNYSIGVKNVFTRLRLNYGERCKFYLESEPDKYTRTTIELDMKEKEV